MSEQKLVPVYYAGTEFEAQIIRGKLRSEGIPAMIQRQSMAMMGSAGDFRVLVTAGWEREARAVLDRPSNLQAEP